MAKLMPSGWTVAPNGNGCPRRMAMSLVGRLDRCACSMSQASSAVSLRVPESRGARRAWGRWRRGRADADAGSADNAPRAPAIPGARLVKLYSWCHLLTVLLVRLPQGLALCCYACHQLIPGIDEGFCALALEVTGKCGDIDAGAGEAGQHFLGVVVSRQQGANLPMVGERL